MALIRKTFPHHQRSFLRSIRIWNHPTSICSQFRHSSHTQCFARPSTVMPKQIPESRRCMSSKNEGEIPYRTINIRAPDDPNAYQINQWYVRVQDQVEKSDALCEIETDDFIVNVPSPRSGWISCINASAGSVVQQEGLLCQIVDSEDAISELKLRSMEVEDGESSQRDLEDAIDMNQVESCRLTHLWNQIDKDKDDLISWAEFVKYHKERALPYSEGSDAPWGDGNGTLSRAEFFSYLKEPVLGAADMDQLGLFLKKWRLDQYEEAMRSHGFDIVDDFATYAEEELEELLLTIGMKPGHAIRFRHAMQDLQGTVAHSPDESLKND